MVEARNGIESRYIVNQQSKVEELFHAALEQPAEKRAEFLRKECAENDQLRGEVEALLNHVSSNDSFLEGSPLSSSTNKSPVLTPGQRLGHFEILEFIGRGGMGEVYKARDTRLDRIVAIKRSNERFIARVDREARAIAALNHPHICHLYDVGPDHLVMEFIDGRPLTGPLPLDQALKYAQQICDALDAAHSKDIVHRDLKPANIAVTKSGIKVLDFGLAKKMRTAAAADDTVTQATTAGVIVGTLQYMSPEQLQGKPIDARSDIFAFGLVVYEMLTGRRAFGGESTAAVIGSILHTEPAEDPRVPESVARILRLCLAKNQEDRWQSARDLKHALEWAALPSEGTARPEHTSSARWWKTAAVAGAALAIVFAALWFLSRNPAQAERTPYRVTIVTPRLDASDGGRIAVSPDGRRIAFITIDDSEKRHLTIRGLDSDVSQSVAGVDDIVNYPFWSPDGKAIGYMAANSYKTVDLATGEVTRLASTASITRGASWGPGRQILFTRGGTLFGAIYRIAESGGEPEQITNPPDHSDVYPQFLPDGKRFLFSAFSGQTGKMDLRVGTLGSRETRSLGTIAGNVVVAAPDVLLFRRVETLYAQRINPKTLDFVGAARPLVENVRYYSVNGFGTFSGSRNGVLAFRRGGNTKNHLRWFDRTGKPLAEIGSADSNWTFALSPDQSRIAVSRSNPETGTNDIWSGDVTRGPISRTTRGGLDSHAPVWSSDGRRLAFLSIRDRHQILSVQESGGASAPRILFKRPVEGRGIAQSDWSPDGRFVVLGGTRGGMLLVDTAAGNEVKPLLPNDSFTNHMPQFSPDGRWLAYASDETGRFEVYVRPFPGVNDGKWQISSGGGTQPRWRADGREMFYIDLDRRITSVPVRSQGTDFEAGQPQPLFVADVPFSLLVRHQFAVSRDGQRILANVLAEEDTRSIELLIHWDALLK